MKKFRWLVCMLMTASLSVVASVTRSGAQNQEREQAISLVIKDIRGRDQSPFKLDGAKASVLFFLTQDCPISNRYAPEIQRIARDYQNRQVRFYLIYIDAAAGLKEIEDHLRDYGLSGITGIKDTQHVLVKATGATVTPEAAVLGESGVILYRGRIDNLYAALGKPRRQVTEHDLRNALDAILRREKVPVARTQAIGCFITSQS